MPKDISELINHEDIGFVRSQIQGYYSTMCDSWRHDFTESEEERMDDDEYLKEDILTIIMQYLVIEDRDDAERVLDYYEYLR